MKALFLALSLLVKAPGLTVSVNIPPEGLNWTGIGLTYSETLPETYSCAIDVHYWTPSGDSTVHAVLTTPAGFSGTKWNKVYRGTSWVYTGYDVINYGPFID